MSRGGSISRGFWNYGRLWLYCVQRRPARLCLAKQSTYELGSLAYRIVTGLPVVADSPLPPIPDLYPKSLHDLLPRLVAPDPG